MTANLGPLQERLARLDEWKRIHMEAFAVLQQEIDELRAEVLRNPLIAESRVSDIETRVRKIEQSEARREERLKLLLVLVLIGQWATPIILHFWR